MSKTEQQSVREQLQLAHLEVSLAKQSTQPASQDWHRLTNAEQAIRGAKAILAG